MYKELTKLINDTPYKLYITMAGGGQSFAHEYLKYSGASKTIAGINIPYSKEAFENFCGNPVDKFVSVDTARLLATKSYEHCLDTIEPIHAIGIGVTCSLATDNEREFRIHKIYIAVHCYEFSSVTQIELQQGMAREQEERLCCVMIFKQLMQVVGIKHVNIDTLLPTTLTPHMVVKHDVSIIFREDVNYSVSDDCKDLLIAPGSYNPYHEGHHKMLELVEDIMQITPHIELSTLNADKGVLDYFEVQKRFSNIDKKFKPILTTLSTFKDKAAHFYQPNRIIYFVIGADTWNRLLQPKYAGPPEELYNMFGNLNVRFLVVNREGYVIESDYWLDRLRILDYRLDKFNVPISSTMLRTQND